jgi:hypothetical protein
MEALEMANQTLGTQPVRYVPVTPPHIPPVLEKVKLVDAPATAKISAQPTTQDVLNAIHDLSKAISQLSKNQQIMQTMLSNIFQYQQHTNSNVTTSFNNLHNVIGGLKATTVAGGPKATTVGGLKATTVSG